MDWLDQFKKKFGGFWNTVLFIAGLVVCLRFSGAEWKDDPLQERLFCAAYLVIGVIATGILWGFCTAFLKRFKRPSYVTSKAPIDFVSGLKYGIIVGIIVMFTVGLLMVDDYLGPLKEVFDLAVEKIGANIP